MINKVINDLCLISKEMGYIEGYYEATEYGREDGIANAFANIMDVAKKNNFEYKYNELEWDKYDNTHSNCNFSKSDFDNLNITSENYPKADLVIQDFADKLMTFLKEKIGDDIMVDFQKMGEWLNECVNEKLIIRVGRYTGDYYLGNEEFEKITGDLFIMTNSHNIFRVVSDDSSIVDDFDVIGSDATIIPINKEFENSITYEVDVTNKESLRAYFPNDEVGKEMFECVQSLPIRFREDAIDVFDSFFDANGIVKETYNLHDVDKVWTYFLEDIIQEMTEKEKETYGF